MFRTAILLIPSIALAAPPRATVIPVPRKVSLAGPVSSHIIYLHRCDVGGCPVLAGTEDDSRTHTSSIAQGDRTIGEFTRSDDVWNAMVACVKATYAAFDITITDVDPGNVPHFEEIIGGHPNDLRNDIPDAGGVAPFNCDEIPNGISFTFDVWGNNADLLCWTVAQETAHTFGLEHEYLGKDPMTYIQGDLPKRFQWEDAQCGTGGPAACQCSAGTQNSYKHIFDLFGVGTPTPPMLSVLSPTDGKKVTPHFPVRVSADDDAAIDRVELWVDGALADTVTTAPWTTTAPDLAMGTHALEIHAIDKTNMSTTSALSIDQGPACTASSGCEGTDVCVAGGCIPGPGETNGLGTVCTRGSECISTLCADGGEQSKHCVAACDPGTGGSCPDGFDCLADGDSGVCWPSSGGCCSASGDPRASLLLGALVLGSLLRRRRR